MLPELNPFLAYNIATQPEEDAFLKKTGEVSSIDMGRDWTEFYDAIFTKVKIPTGTILDIGANSARFSRWLKEHGQERRVISFDIRDIENQAGEEQVRGTARSLPFGNSSVDSVTSFFSVPFLASDEMQKASLNEMARVAKERVVIWPVPTQWYWREHMMGAKAINNSILTKLESFLDNLDKYQFNIEAINNIPTQNQVLEIIKS